MSLLRDRLEQRIAALIKACPRCWGALLDGLESGDLMGHVGQGEEHTETRKPVPRSTFAPAALAARVEQNIRAAAVLAIEDKMERDAALDRPIVAERWPLEVGPTWVETDEDMAAIVALDSLPSYAEEEGGLEPDGWVWPASVNPFDVGTVIAKGGTAESDIIADALKKGFYSPGRGFSFKVGEVVKVGAEERGRPLPPGPAEVWFRAHEGQAREGLLLWSPVGFGVILAALAEVRAGALAFRGTPIPATRPMRAAVQTISRGLSEDWGDLETKGGRCVVKLHWPGSGSAPPHQLALGFPESVDVAIVAGILDDLQTDGLRDYLVLHRMAAEQGRTGEIRWSWREHRENTAYDRRIRAGNLSDSAAQREVTARLWRLKSAELRETVAMPGGKTRFERIGPFGLIDIPAGYGEEGALDLAPIALNPAIYRGAAVGTQKRGRNFTMLPDAAFALDGRALRLAVLLALQMRIRRDDAAGTVRLTASKLWEWLGSRGGNPKAIPRKRWQATDDTLRKVLDVLEDASVIGTWNREGGDDALPGALYQIDPVAAWRDAVVHRVPPALPPSKAAIPWTGAELRRWREEHRLSQAAAAAELGVGVATVKRAEGNPAKELGAALVEALARCRAVSRSG